MIANGFHVLNRLNILLANETVYNLNPGQQRVIPVGSFGAPRVFVLRTQGTGPAISTSNRSFQLGLRLEF